MFTQQRFGFLTAVSNTALVTHVCQHGTQPPTNRLVVINDEHLQLLSYTALRVFHDARSRLRVCLCLASTSKPCVWQASSAGPPYHSILTAEHRFLLPPWNTSITCHVRMFALLFILNSTREWIVPLKACGLPFAAARNCESFDIPGARECLETLHPLY